MPPIAKVIAAVVVVIVAAALGIPLTSGPGSTDRAGPSGEGGSEAFGLEGGARPAPVEEQGTGAIAEDHARPASAGGSTALAPAVGQGLDDLRGLIADRASGRMVTVTAEIFRVLEDDHDGSRHQRFLIAVGREGRRTLTVKISHNIDLAPRVPAEEGDVITVRGEFEWNDLGGVIHWTHHDPARRREGGWIEFDGRRYE